MLTLFLLSRRVSAIIPDNSYSRIPFHTFVSNNYRDMAKLYINKDIVADKDKMINWYLTGDEGMSFSDVQSFIDWMDPNDNRIDIELHSCGGRCDEGYAMYDALRATGKEISCKVVGKCASMATIILLAAPIERRSAYEHAKFLIHSPYYPEGIALGDMTPETLRQAAESLEEEKERMLAVYVERTGKDRAALEVQMATNDWFDGEKAVELGFISQVIAPASAAAKDKKFFNSNFKSMAKEKVTVAQAFHMLGVALGVAKDTSEAVAMEITTSTGDVLTVEREEGEIQVGDPASPDGEWVLEDGRTVIVTDGVITEIKEPSNDEDENEALKKENEELKAEIENLKANAKSENDNKILAAVKAAGGESFLAKHCSTYVPAGRAFNTSAKKTEKQEPVSLIDKMLEEKRAKQKNKFKNV